MYLLNNLRQGCEHSGQPVVDRKMEKVLQRHIQTMGCLAETLIKSKNEIVFFIRKSWLLQTLAPGFALNQYNLIVPCYIGCQLC